MSTKITVTLVLASLLVVTACTKTVKQDEGDVLEVHTYNTIMQSGKDLIDPVHGKQTAIWYGPISGANGTNANGVGFIHRFEDGASNITANVNILVAPKGSHFMGLLTTPDGARSIEIGEIASIIGDARHSGKLDTTVDTTGMTMMNVYLAKNGQKASDGVLVASGTLKEAPPKK